MAEASNTSRFTSTSLKEVGKLLGQYFGLLFAIIAFVSINTSKEKSLLLMALAFMVTLYYTVLVLVKVLQLHVPLMILVNLLLGALVSLLALMIISPIIAWTYLGLWIFFIFGLVCYKNGKEIYLMIPTRIKSCIQSQLDKHINIHNLELHGVESLPV
ncbi:unnamed protein product [Vicia faba]|uniref:Transmembrane protein n=1 Tax=Vicia faba TaxID=3906 RepID=A0AAV0Z6X3_VICFA|nr:unnamed protein product [Vicia faba]